MLMKGDCGGCNEVDGKEPAFCKISTVVASGRLESMQWWRWIATSVLPVYHNDSHGCEML